MRFKRTSRVTKKYLDISIYWILLVGIMLLLSSAVIIAKSYKDRNSTTKITANPETVEQKPIANTASPSPAPTPSTSKPTTQTNTQPKPTQTTNTQTATTPTPKNPFQVGFAAWYVFNRRTEVGKTMPETTDKTFGNPDHYCAKITNASYPTAGTPSVNDIACQNSKLHVAFVEKVNDDGGIWVSEMNSTGQKSMTDITPWGGWYHTDYKLIPKENLTGYFFIQ